MSFNIGENVGPYRITEQLGQGGMATVYKAYHAALDRYVALKVLHPAFNEDKTFELRFQREARVVAKLEHPNIVPIYDYAEHEHRPYLVMKFIEGETLKARLARGPLTAGEIQKVVDSVGAALSYAHRQGILHRDIKPSNVLIAADGVIYLADFGLARIAEAGESTLSSDAIMGTPQYISPEQAMGKKELNEGTDIYSFGVMLYELVVGQVPFSADTPFSIIHDHIYTPLPLPRQVNPRVPEAVERVLLKALSKERADRYASVDEMVRAFKMSWDTAGVPMQGAALTIPRLDAAQVAKIESAPAVDYDSPTVAPVAVQKKKRSPWTLAAIMVILFVCLLFGFFALRNLRSNRPGALPFGAQPSAQPSPRPTLAPPVVSGGNTQAAVSPEVTAALLAVQQNPDDPKAHLALGLAYWDAKQFHQAAETLDKAANLAGSNQDFLLTAASELAAQGCWPGSAAMYLRAADLFQPGTVPQDVRDRLHEAVYKAAGIPEALTFLTFDRVTGFDQPLGWVARGRFALYFGSIAEARKALAQAQRIKPDFPEAVLLEAEIDIKDGKVAEARQLLLSISSNPAKPEWMHAEAEKLLTTLQ